MLRRFIVWLSDWLLGRPSDSVGPVALPEQGPPCVEPPARPPRSRDVPPDPRTAMLRIITAFDSAHPVRQRKDLHGRDDKLELLFEAVLFNRQHAIIHGARGSCTTRLHLHLMSACAHLVRVQPIATEAVSSRCHP